MRTHFKAIAKVAATALLLSFIWVAQPAVAATGTITNTGNVWKDTAGATLQARGAGIFQVGSTYYMVGEDKSNGAGFTAVACYSSTNLSTWTRQTNALTAQGTGDLAAGRIIERPKVIYNETTQKYVMYMHVDSNDYQAARVGVATSSTPCGAYTYLGSSRPLGYESRDMGLFKDTDGKAYLLTEDRSNGTRIDLLSADYLSVVSNVATLHDNNGWPLESPALIKKNGVYFFLGSHLTGWNTNDNEYSTATSLSGPWSATTKFAPLYSDTFDTQVSSVLPIQGTSTTSYMFLGDRWNSGDLNASVPIWLPLTVSGTSLSVTWYDSWSVDTVTGVVTATAPTGTSTSWTGQASGRCSDSPQNRNGRTVALWDCNGGVNQKWALTSKDEIRGYGKSRCLDAFGTTPGSAVGVWDCHGGINQKWVKNSDGTISSSASGLCLDVSGGGTGNGSAIILWNCTGAAWQKWTQQSS